MNLSLLPIIVKEMRPKQWTKNVLLFAGLVFSGHAHEPKRAMIGAIAFAIFCGLSGVVYIFNDIKDAESDREHPTKCKRPIASGALSIPAAWTTATVVLLLSLGAAWLLPPKFFLLALGYFVLMIAYSASLKHMVILDLLIIASGFVMRAVAGIWAIELPGEALRITPWFLTCLFFGALFIILCKRRNELQLLSEDAKLHRPVLEHYSVPFLDQMIGIATAACIMSYTLYAVLAPAGGPRGSWLVVTVPLVLHGLFRYLYLVYRLDLGGAPEILLLKDRPLLVTVVLWLLIVSVIYAPASLTLPVQL